MASLAVGLFIGCQLPDKTQTPGPAQPPPGESIRGESIRGESIKLFADNSIYLHRDEPVRTVSGVLSRVAVRTGPNTREHPIRLRTDEGEWGVYSEGLSPRLLDAIIDRPLRIKGKWIDQSKEGAPVEVWIGEVTDPGEDHFNNSLYR